MMLDALDGRGAAREFPPAPVRRAPSRLPGRPAPSPAASACLPGGRPCQPPRPVITAQTRTVVVTAQTRTVVVTAQTRTARRRAIHSTFAGASC